MTLKYIFISGSVIPNQNSFIKFQKFSWLFFWNRKWRHWLHTGLSIKAGLQLCPKENFDPFHKNCLSGVGCLSLTHKSYDASQFPHEGHQPLTQLLVMVYIVYL